MLSLRAVEAVNTMWPMDTIVELVQALIAAQGQARQAAKLIGVTESSLSQTKNGKRGLGLESLLRLAHALGRSPADVLRVAGKIEELDLITRSFGPSARVVASVSSGDTALCAAFRRAGQRDQSIVRSVLGLETAALRKKSDAIARSISKQRAS